MKPKNTSRRAFLSAGLILPVVGATSRMGFASTGLASFKPEEPADTKPNASAKLDYRILGRTGLKVTTLGFGCMTTSDPSVIKRAADMGINYFDTARGYQQGNNERMVAAALGARRKQIVLSSKSHGANKAELQQHLETSLRELKTDYSISGISTPRSSPAEVTDEMIEEQQLVKKQGKIRFAGVSTHSGQPQLLPWMAQKGVFDVVLTGYNFTMDAGMSQAIETAAKAGMGVVAMKVMAGGFRSVKPNDPHLPQAEARRRHAGRPQVGPPQAQVATTIPSMTDMDQLDENLKAMAEPFAAGDEKFSPRIWIHHGRSIAACAASATAPADKGLPVADVLRFLTYADGYGQFALGAGEIPGVRCRAQGRSLRRLH